MLFSYLDRILNKYFPTNKRIYTDKDFNQPWKRALRAAYYTACILLGIVVITGFIAFTMLVLAGVLMNIYATAPVAAAAISTVMMGLIEWGAITSLITGIFALGPLLFSKTAWLFKLVPPDQPYNMVDALRDTYATIALILTPITFLITQIGYWFSWWDKPKKDKTPTPERKIDIKAQISTEDQGEALSSSPTPIRLSNSKGAEEEEPQAEIRASTTCCYKKRKIS